MKKLRVGLITRDCSGMNACIRAVVRTASALEIEVYGVRHGYNGLMNGELTPLSSRDVSGILGLGGTILKTARAKEFLTRQGQARAVATIRKNGLDALVVAGGNGSLSGAHLLFERYSIPVVGIPATIDNDVNGIDITIGADTAINVAMEAIDKIRDTATSLERIFVVEVMGRDCGYIALQSGIAGGCENVIIPENKFNIREICRQIQEGEKRGKQSWIIIVAEGKARATDVAAMIRKITKLETREAVLGHIQRGGTPTAFDRILAARYGNFAVTLIYNRKYGVITALQKDDLTTIPLRSVLKPKKIDPRQYLNLVGILT
jgi:6-phosphofructokinase 1